jgi:hypothetical protein
MGLTTDRTRLNLFTIVICLLTSRATCVNNGDVSEESVLDGRQNNSNNGFLRKADYPFLASQDNKDNKWTSVSHTVEFLPADESIVRRLHGNTHEMDTAGGIHRKQQEENDQVIGETQSNFHYPERKLFDYSGGGTRGGYGSSQYDKQPFVEGVSDYSSYQQAWRMLGFMIDCDADTSYSYNNRNNNHNSQDKGDYLTGQGCQRYVVWAAVSYCIRLM